MRTSSRALFGLLLPLLLCAACRLTFPTAARKASSPSASGQDPTARSFPPLQVGAPAPDAPLLDKEGHEYRLSHFRGQRVLLAFFCDSPQCIQFASQWERLHRQAPRVAVLGISTIGPAGVFRFRQATQVTFPLLFDQNYHFARRHERPDCPSSAVIDEVGIVVYLSDRAASSQKVSNTLRQYLCSPYRLPSGGQRKTNPQPS